MTDPTSATSPTVEATLRAERELTPEANRAAWDAFREYVLHDSNGAQGEVEPAAVTAAVRAALEVLRTPPPATSVLAAVRRLLNDAFFDDRFNTCLIYADDLEVALGGDDAAEDSSLADRLRELADRADAERRGDNPPGRPVISTRELRTLLGARR